MKPVILVCLLCSMFLGCGESVQIEDKAPQVAAFIQQKVNTGGYQGCQTRVIGKNLVQCDLNFPAGTSSLSVLANAKGVAETFGQIGLASTIYFAGYSENLKVCEFQWDMYSRTIKQTQ